MSRGELGAAATPFVAEVEREDDWWMVHVLDPDVVTQAARWSEVEIMARGVIIAVLDLDENASFDLELVPVFDDEPARLLREAEELEERARELTVSAGEAKRTAVQTLRTAGWTLQGIAAGLGLSHQRVEQIAKSPDPRPEDPRPGHVELTAEAGTERRGRSSPGHSARAVSAVPNPRATTRGSVVSTARSHRAAITGRYVTASSAAHRRSTSADERDQS